MSIMKLKLHQITELCDTLIKYYRNLLDDNDLNNICYTIQHLATENLKIIEELLSPIVKKVWDFELNSGNYIIVSWNKYASRQKSWPLVFATLSEKNNIVSFCGMTYGIEYAISYDAIIGALPKDGATLIEDASKKNIYTIGVIDDKVINSYNGATKLITPKQLVRETENNYPSKHNELILNVNLIKEIGVFELEEVNKNR